MRQHYTADNIILAAAGNVQHDTLVEQARDALWQITPSTRQADLVSTPFETKSGIVIADNRNLQQVYFTLGWPAPSYTDSDRYTWHVFSTLLGGGPTSRLYRKLREERGLVYHIAAQYQAYQDTGAFVVEGATRPETLIPVLAGILIELATMGEDPLSLDDHYRATQSLISQHLVSGDSAYVRMSRLALQEHYFRRAITSDEVVQGLRTQSSDAIQKVASSTFAAGLPVAALVGPVTDDLLVMISEMFADFGDTPELHVVSNEVALPVT
jgi:predicted Zn-dependent peptidase